MNNLLASTLPTSYAWVIDVVFFLVLLGGLLLGIKKGFVAGVCKLAGTVFAVLFAFVFCGNLEAFCQSKFGLRDILANAINNSNVAQLVGTILCFIALLIVIKLAAWLLNKMLSGIVEEVGFLSVANKILGAVLGLLKAALFLFVVFAILYWLNNANVNEMIAQSKIVSKIYNGEWFRAAIAYLSNFFVTRESVPT